MKNSKQKPSLFAWILLILRVSVLLYLSFSNQDDIIFKIVIILTYIVIEVVIFVVPTSQNHLAHSYLGKCKKGALVVLACLTIFIFINQIQIYDQPLNYIFIIKNTICNVLLLLFLIVTNAFFEKNITSILTDKVKKLLPTLFGSFFLLGVVIMLYHWFGTEVVFPGWMLSLNFNYSIGFYLSVFFIYISIFLGIVLFLQSFFFQKEKLADDFYDNFPTSSFLFIILWFMAYGTFSFDSNPENNIGLQYIIYSFVILISFLVTLVVYSVNYKNKYNTKFILPRINYIIVSIQIVYTTIVVYIDKTFDIIPLIILYFITITIFFSFLHWLVEPETISEKSE